ncbi:MAG: large ribosomal subunit protein uL22 [Thomasclavelia spiroformis]
MLEYVNKVQLLQSLKVKSAAQNAVYNEGAEAEKLYIKEIYVDEGPTLKDLLQEPKVVEQEF